MKIFAYGVRDFDEVPFFNEYGREFGVEIGMCPDPISLDNIHLSKGSDYISVITNPVTAPMLDALKAQGIKMVSTRTIGFDHVDCAHAKELGMPVSNATYNADCVAEYSIMLLLMALRKMKRIMQRAVINDFTLKGVNGGILHERTVGVIGTGRIGRTVVRDLQGFGCKVYAYDVFENPDLGVEYLPLDELYKRCDVISIHAPLTEETFHMINKEAIDMMPDGVVIINTARGGLIDSDALIDALESGKVAACGLDVVEDEFDMYYYDRRSDVLGNRRLSILRDMPNVVVTPHMAFYTDRTVSDMVRNSIISCVKHSKGEDNPFRVA